MQTNGENQTPSTCQSHIACLTSSSKASQPRASVVYSAHFMPRNRKEFDGEAKDSGTPSVTARRAAREKLRTEETEMSVLARHMLMALRDMQRGAAGSQLADERVFHGASMRIIQHTGGITKLCYEHKS